MSNIHTQFEQVYYEFVALHKIIAELVDVNKAMLDRIEQLEQINRANHGPTYYVDGNVHK